MAYFLRYLQINRISTYNEKDRKSYARNIWGIWRFNGKKTDTCHIQFI